nr:hypothetical protein BaRGS_033727 [Batillaria attramentaria]
MQVLLQCKELERARRYLEVDEARVLFQDALRLAKESDDMDTKWQMEEALGAVHFRLALHDIENPHDMTADIKVALPESRMEHLHKSLTSYKAALKDLANTSGDKSAMQDRVLEKFTQVQAFTQKATAIPYRLTKPNLTATITIAPVQAEPLTDAGRPSDAASAVTDKDDGETETSDEENEDGETGQEEVGEAEEEEESEEDEDEEGGEESGTTDDDPEEEEEGSHHVPSTPVRLPNAEDDEDDEQAQLDLYRQQLESDDGRT